MLNKKGLSLMESAVTMAAFLVIFTGVMIASHTSIKGSLFSDQLAKQTTDARNALANISNDISSSKISAIAVINCNPSECLGQKIRFKIPITDLSDVAGSFYTSEGKLKFGAYMSNGSGSQTCFNEYLVSLNHQLVKSTTCEAGAYCGDGTCSVSCGPGPGGVCSQEICPTDCAVCGDGICVPPVEVNASCPQDCLVCGDGVCGIIEKGCADGIPDCIPDCGNCSSSVASPTG